MDHFGTSCDADILLKRDVEQKERIEPQDILRVKFSKWGQRPSFSNGEVNETKSSIKARNEFSEDG